MCSFNPEETVEELAWRDTYTLYFILFMLGATTWGLAFIIS